jgi:hypothetical protein
MDMLFKRTCFKEFKNYLNYDEYIPLLPKMLSHTKKYKKTHAHSNSLKLYDLIAIKFPSNGNILSGFITIVYRYNLKNGIITYSDIKYSDERMEKYLEENPNVIRNIDSYLKNKMLESELKSG